MQKLFFFPCGHWHGWKKNARAHAGRLTSVPSDYGRSCLFASDYGRACLQRAALVLLKARRSYMRCAKQSSFARSERARSPILPSTRRWVGCYLKMVKRATLCYIDTPLAVVIQSCWKRLDAQCLFELNFPLLKLIIIVVTSIVVKIVTTASGGPI